MKEKEISVRHPYFILLKSGEKTVEGRLYDEFFRDLKKEDILTFKDESDGETFRSLVKDILVFKDFSEMIKHFGREVLGFKDHSFKDTLKTYNSFYTKEEIDKMGVCGVCIEKA